MTTRVLMLIRQMRLRQLVRQPALRKRQAQLARIKAHMARQNVRQEVVQCLNNSLKEHPDIWAELASY